MRKESTTATPHEQKTSTTDCPVSRAFNYRPRCLTRENAVRQGKAKKVPLPVRFLRHIDLQNRPVPEKCEGFGLCLLWNGAPDTNGRAIMGIEGKTKMVSHVAWYLYHGYWPKRGTWLCHACDNPACVNPLHLIEGDGGDNGYDRAAKNRGGILQACSPPDPSSDETHEAEVNRFLRFLRTKADDWRKSKVV